MAARLDTIQDAIQFLKLNKIENFVARTLSEKDNTAIFKTNPDDTLQENLDRFEQILSMTAGSFYIVEQGNNRGAFRIEVKNERIPTVQGVGTSYSPELTEERANQIAEKKFEELMMKKRLSDLEEENKELQKEARRGLTITEQFMERLNPYIGTIVPAIMNKFVPQPVKLGLQGLEREDEEVIKMQENVDIADMSDDEKKAMQDRLATAIGKWAMADPDFVEYIEAFADFASSNKTISINAFMKLDYKAMKEMFSPEKLKSFLV